MANLQMTYGIDVDSFQLTSSFTVVNNTIRGKTVGQVTKQIVVSGLPAGAQITGVTLACGVGNPTVGVDGLSVNGVNLTPNTTNQLTDFVDTVTGNGTYDFKFIYVCAGSTSPSDGTYRSQVLISDVQLVVFYSGDAPDEESESDTPPDTYEYPDSHNICVYGPDDDNFTTNGLGILTPSKCVVREEAGGEYELEMELPLVDTAWQSIEIESIIKAPIPTTVIDQFIQPGAAYWKVKSTQGSVQVKSKVPTLQRVASTSGIGGWGGSSTLYARGAKVAVGGKVYQYSGMTFKQADGTFKAKTASPPGNGWTDVTSYDLKTNTGKTLATLARNEIFTKIADVNQNWIRIKTAGGVTGYIETSTSEWYAAMDEPVQGRELRQQCFRVYRIEKDSETRTVRISARHLSYDFARVYLGRCEAKEVTASTAISVIEGATLYEDNRHIYTDIDATEKCDLDSSWDSGVSALLNPDAGIVAQLQAKLIRDNDDFFILKDEHTDRGFRLDYGNNLKAVSWSIDTSNMVTRVVPHCKDSDDSDLFLTAQWVDSPKINDYPVIYVEPLAVNCKVDQKGTTVDGEEKPKLTKEDCLALMQHEAEKRFSVDHADEPEVTIDVDLVMLGSTVEYQHLAPLEALFMYDTVHIRHPQLNLDITAYMTGYEYDAILRRYNRITLTNARRRKDTSVSGFDLRDNSIRFEKLSATAVDRLRS